MSDDKKKIDTTEINEQLRMSDDEREKTKRELEEQEEKRKKDNKR